MRIVGLIVAAAILMSVAKFAVLAMFLALMIALIVSVMTKPVETLALLGLAMLAFLLQVHAVATLTAFVALCIAGMIAKRSDS